LPSALGVPTKNRATFAGNPAIFILKDPWLSVPASRRVWLIWYAFYNRNIPACQELFKYFFIFLEFYLAFCKLAVMYLFFLQISFIAWPASARQNRPGHSPVA
jgi:hypothetical protein